jgi:hypothetical protein
MNRVLIVGINPSSADSKKTCASIKRLCRWTEEMGIKHFSFTNCVPFPGKYTVSDIDYEFLSGCTESYNKVLALGGFPSKALSKLGINHFTLPHPSGLNRKLNDREYEKHILEKCIEYIN